MLVLVVMMAGTGMGIGAAWGCCQGVLKYLSRDKHCTEYKLHSTVPESVRKCRWDREFPALSMGEFGVGRRGQC